MRDLSSYRIGNYACYNGKAIKLNQAGTKNRSFLKPLPLTEKNLIMIGYSPFMQDTISRVYSFDTAEDEAITVVFHNLKGITVMDLTTKQEYSIKWLHELQNIIEDKTIELLNLTIIL